MYSNVIKKPLFLFALTAVFLLSAMGSSCEHQASLNPVLEPQEHLPPPVKEEPPANDDKIPASDIKPDLTPNIKPEPVPEKPTTADSTPEAPWTKKLEICKSKIYHAKTFTSLIKAWNLVEKAGCRHPKLTERYLNRKELFEDRIREVKKHASYQARYTSSEDIRNLADLTEKKLEEVMGHAESIPAVGQKLATAYFHRLLLAKNLNTAEQVQEAVLTTKVLTPEQREWITAKVEDLIFDVKLEKETGTKSIAFASNHARDLGIHSHIKTVNGLNIKENWDLWNLVAGIVELQGDYTSAQADELQKIVNNGQFGKHNWMFFQDYLTVLKKRHARILEDVNQYSHQIDELMKNYSKARAEDLLSNIENNFLPEADRKALEHRIKGLISNYP